jgi:hypothetical protein
MLIFFEERGLKFFKKNVWESLNFMKKYVKKIKTKNFSKDTSQCTNFCKRCTASSRFQAFRNELSVILAANEKIAFWLQKKKFLTKSKNVTSSSILINVWVDIVENHLVGLTSPFEWCRVSSIFKRCFARITGAI